MSEEVNESTSPELPQWLIDRISKSIDNGVFLRMAHHHTPEGWRDLSAIVWRPGKPNELARIIIKHCDQSMELELDGHKFRIEPVHESQCGDVSLSRPADECTCAVTPEMQYRQDIACKCGHRREDHGKATVDTADSCFKCGCWGFEEAGTE